MSGPGKGQPDRTLHCVMALNIASMYITYKDGDKGHPCLTPLVIDTGSDNMPFTWTLVEMVWYIVLTRRNTSSSTPSFDIAANKNLWSTISNALLWPRETNTVSLLPNLRVNSIESLKHIKCLQCYDRLHHMSVLHILRLVKVYRAICLQPLLIPCSRR
jgi:hypothetical protein